MEKLIEEWSDWYAKNEQYDDYQTVVKLNRFEFLSIVKQIAESAKSLTN